MELNIEKEQRRLWLINAKEDAKDIITEKIAVIFFELDEDSTENLQILYATPQADNIFGYMSGELTMDKKLSDLLPPDFVKEHFKYVLGFMKNPHERVMGTTRQLTAQHKTEGIFFVEISLYPTMFMGRRAVMATFIKSKSGTH